MASKSGYDARLLIGHAAAGATTYDGAELTNVVVTVSNEPVEVSDLASTYKERTQGLSDVEVTGTKNYVSTKFAKAAASMHVSTFVVTVFNPSGTAVFAGSMLLTRGAMTIPMGAITEEVTLVGYGPTPVFG